MKIGPALTLIFITLKLTGHITWSWWWVFAPIWGGILLAMICGLLAAIYEYFAEKLMTPEQKLKRACDRMAEAIKNRR